MFVDQLLNGLAQGGIYALVAVGLALIFALRLTTFAHGEVFMIGAFVAYTIVKILKINIIFSFFTAICTSALLGMIIEFTGFRLLRKSPHISSVLVTIGFSIVLLNLAQLIWGAETKSYPYHVIDLGQFTFLSYNLSIMQFIVYAITISMLLFLYFLLYHTKIGRAIRATAQDHEAAFVLGVNINRIYSLTFALGSALGGLAGVLVGIYYNAAYPTMGALIGLKAFSACILGGLTSIPGAVIGGIFLGIIENLSVAYISAGYRHVFSFVILILVLVIKPSGLFGKQVVIGS
jgi:branched-chain amino acid transport system permease protein